ncbi:MAG: hypothetical protein EOP59_17930 [Sphingomonadales bacterium]|nr:MAG: hypothetical protein EOP59_17930 [Sphingomonadales bacterium]
MRVQPADPALEALVRDYIRSNPWACVKTCVALDLGGTGEKRRVAIVTGSAINEATLPFDPAAPQAVPTPRPLPTLGPTSTVEVRAVSRRQIFVDGKPLGQPLDDAPLEGAPPPR